MAAYDTIDMVLGEQSDSNQVQPEELTEIIRRAHEIDSQTQLMLKPHPEIDEYVKAAEEAGLSKDSILQALRERLTYPLEAYQPGSFVFARSVDGHSYVAKLESISGRTASIRFMNGSDGMVDVSDLKFFNLLPGMKVQYLSPSMGMWFEAPVSRFNRDLLTLTINYWGNEETVPLDKVRLQKERKPGNTTDWQAKVWMIAAAAGTVGTAVGMLIMKLLTEL